MSQHPDNQASSSKTPPCPSPQKESLPKPHGQPRQPRHPSGKQYRALSTAVEGRFVGPMPTAKFLDEFMDPRSKRPEIKFEDFSVTSAEPSARVLSAFRTLSPSLHVYNSRGRIDEATGFSATISLYSKPMVEADDGRTTSDFAEMELFVNAWPEEDDDPFSDEGEGLHYPFELDSQLRRTIRGQIVGCAAAVSALQYRTHFFSVVTFGDQARLMRWDPSGVVVSQRFPCVGNNILAEFLWRFDGMTLDARGHDTTVVRVEDPWPTHLAPLEVLKRLADGDNNGHNPKRRHRHFCIMKIPDRTDPAQEIDVVISSPLDYCLSNDLPHGRRTRPLYAYDVGESKVVFVKQYWRLLSNGQGTMKEGDVYKLLEHKKVRNLPTFGAGNDVRDLSSVSQRFVHSDSVRWPHPTKRLDEYRLYRMSLHTVGIPLSNIRSPKELLRVVRDAMLCHDDAFFNANILHGDISTGNIMIDKNTRKGILVDWELASDISQGLPNKRIGTWEFMSYGLLFNHKAPHTVADDRESAIYVLVWMILEYLHPTLNHQRSFDSELFTEKIFMAEDLPLRGGAKKLSFLVRAAFSSDISLECDQHIAELISRLQREFGQRYIRYDEGDPVYTAHQQRVAVLSQPNWFVDQLTLALDDNVWSNDLLETPQAPESLKRTSAEAALLDEGYSPKSRKLSSGARDRRSEIQ